MSNEPNPDQEEFSRRRRHSTVAAPAAMHDIVTLAYDDWDDIWHPNRTVTQISPGLPDDIESF